jgi:ribosomal protein S11
MRKQLSDESSKKGRLGILYISSSFSNIFITMTDLEGKVLFSISGGTIRNTFLKLTKNKRSKRNKVAPGVLTELAKKVKDQMQILSLNSVEVRSKVSFRYLVRFFLTQLNY